MAHGSYIARHLIVTRVDWLHINVVKAAGSTVDGSCSGQCWDACHASVRRLESQRCANAASAPVAMPLIQSS